MGSSEEEEEVVMVKRMGSYGEEVRVLSVGEESAAEETMLLWGIQQPTFSKPNAFVSQTSLQLRLDACGQTLSILQSPSSLTTPGVTGAVMWDSGVVLAKFLEHSVDSGMLLLQGKKVIELGSGCGLVGCVAALLGAEVTLTDMPDRLRLLRKNVECNLSEVTLTGSATVMELVWGDDPQPHLIHPSLPHYGTTFTFTFTFFVTPNESFGFISVLGSDVIYSEEAVADLVATLQQLSGSETTIFLAGELRNGKKFLLFLLSIMIIVSILSSCTRYYP